MPMGSTFEIGTQIILLKFDGFLQRLDLKYDPSLVLFFSSYYIFFSWKKGPERVTMAKKKENYDEFFEG